MKQVGNDDTKDLLVSLQMLVVMLQVIELIVQLPVLVDELYSNDGSNVIMLVHTDDIVEISVVCAETQTIEFCCLISLFS